ncbi:hypothetical protein P22_1210 [Propionispora sp. 2/2-37]|uniref:hypothetical protein n=1 Tax=Propionispora sp. 2/2-37 TaxID=1677858 RepID=UPI0006BB6C19|nr:hypothetical protein [Propionispora sp. 2/2-37]CUH95141.1 hypothetical protein P22_1210 [Propionispora sp. 2/2-37]
MKKIRSLLCLAVLFLSLSLLWGGCGTNITPVDPRPSTPVKPPAGQVAPAAVKVTYNYGSSGPVELSSRQITLKVGQKLILEPTPGLTKHTRFRSSGENFFGDIMRQESEQTGKLVFTAVKAGKGKLQIIPNNTETERSADLWVIVQ